MATEKKVFQTREEMPPRYRETLEQMMKSQAYRELAAARMFGHGLQYVDSSKWLKFLVWHIGEETEHYLLRFSRMVRPAYSVRNKPRRCSSGTTMRPNSSNITGKRLGMRTKPSPPPASKISCM